MELLCGADLRQLVLGESYCLHFSLPCVSGNGLHALSCLQAPHVCMLASAAVVCTHSSSAMFSAAPVLLAVIMLAWNVIASAIFLKVGSLTHPASGRGVG